MSRSASLLQRLSQHYQGLSKSQKKVAEYIIHDNKHAAFMTLQELADATGTSKSTVERLARGALGFGSFLDFRTELQHLLRETFSPAEKIRSSLTTPHTPAQTLQAVLQEDIANLEATLRNVSQEGFSGIIQNLIAAKRIFILGLGSSTAIASLLAFRLTLLHPNVELITGDSGRTRRKLLWLSADDLLFAISFPRYSKSVAEDTAYAKERGARIIVLTDRLSSPLIPYADAFLTVSAERSTLVSSLTSAVAVTDAIVAAVAQSNPEVLQNVAQLSVPDLIQIDPDGLLSFVRAEKGKKGEA